MLADFVAFTYVVVFIMTVVIIIRWPKSHKLITAMLLTMAVCGIAAAILISR